MMNPGSGYRFTRTASGITLDTTEPFPSSTAVTRGPFTVVNLGKVGSDYKFMVIAGQVDNLVPQLGATADAARKLDAATAPTETWNFSGSTYYSYVYLKVGCDTSTTPDTFPVSTGTDTKYPRVVSETTEQTASDTNGFLLLASAYKDPTTNDITVWQYVQNSQWADRIKVTGSTATYFFAAV